MCSSDLLELAQLVNKKEAYLVIIGSNPILNSPHRGCIDHQWYNYSQRMMEDCHFLNMQMSEENRFIIRQNNHFNQLANSTQKSFVFVDVLAHLCNQENICNIGDSQKFYLRDDNHLSPAGADAIHELISNSISRVLQSKY